jgi:hypothetical protein
MVEDVGKALQRILLVVEGLALVESPRTALLLILNIQEVFQTKEKVVS